MVIACCRRQRIEVRSGDHSMQSAGKIFRLYFFSYQDGLLWHLRTLHCKQSLLSKVSWRAWHCDLPQAARLKLDQLIIQDFMEWNQVNISMVSDQQVGRCLTRPMRHWLTVQTMLTLLARFAPDSAVYQKHILIY